MANISSGRLTAVLAMLGLTTGVLASCGDSGDSGGELSSGGSAGNNGFGGLGFGGTLVTGVGGSTGGPMCTSDSACTSGQVCHPVSRTCVPEGDACEEHSDCPLGRYCDTGSESCLPGVTGSPCDSDENCTESAQCEGNLCGCSGLVYAQEEEGGPLDIYFIFDRTSSMGEDCDWEPGTSPPVNSKACFATYAMSEYLTSVDPAVNTRLAFNFMSLDDGCDGTPYATPLIDLTDLPLATDHQMIQAISAETFEGGNGTQIEGALRGIAAFTANNETPGREMIGVLMTDGDPTRCTEEADFLAGIIGDHLAASGIRTFIIGMEGASNDRLETYASAGGAEPHDDWCGDGDTPCHYWNVGDGSGDALAEALTAIISQAIPLPCEYDIENLQPPANETLDYGKINISLTDPNGTSTIIGKVQDEAACASAGEPAWYYDSNIAPTTISLCPSVCEAVTSAEAGSRVSVVVGCQPTDILE